VRGGAGWIRSLIDNEMIWYDMCKKCVRNADFGLFGYEERILVVSIRYPAHEHAKSIWRYSKQDVMVF